MAKTVIYVEDEPNDAFFMERAFRQSAPGYALRVLNNGHEANEFLNSSASLPYDSEERPALVVLDLNLPGQSGLEVLRNIRSNDALRYLPVIMYTSSNQEVDIVEAYARGCNGYLVKPQGVQALGDIISSLAGFWLRDNQYPSAPRPAPVAGPNEPTSPQYASPHRPG